MALIVDHKQRMILLCLVHFALYASGVNALRPVLLSCERNDSVSEELNLEKGEQGLPGKRGPNGALGGYSSTQQQINNTYNDSNVFEGPRGFNGNKGDKGDEGTIAPAWTNRITNLETQNMLNLQNITSLLQRQKEILKKLEVFDRRDCDDVARQGHNESGLYNIVINGNFASVYCDLHTDGGKWLVFQRRLNEDVDFYRSWNEYVEGFGNKYGNWWLGLENIHGITSSGNYELRVDIEDWDGNTAFAKYNTFSVGSSNENYLLQVSGYSGNAGDSLVFHSGRAFTTKDQDNDLWGADNCAIHHFGGWWYAKCHASNLNGRYRNVGPGDATGLDWRLWKNVHYSMKSSWMRIRRR